MTDSKKFNPIYLLSILYVLYVYSFPFWFFEVKTDNALFYPIMLGVLIAFAFVETAVLLIFRKKLSDQTVYTAAIIIKYSLIPFYIISGNIISLMFLVPMMMGMSSDSAANPGWKGWQRRASPSGVGAKPQERGLPGVRLPVIRSTAVWPASYSSG